MDDDKRRSDLVMQVRAAYAARQQPASRRGGRTGRDVSPPALETTLADISEEVTADAIARRRREGNRR